jgi:hypothetical protein
MPPSALDQRVAQRLGQLSLQVLSLQAQVETQHEEIAKLTAERDRLLNDLAQVQMERKEMKKNA